MSLLFAATYPERTTAILLCGSELKEETTDDWPWGEATREEFDASMATVSNTWGEGALRAKVYAPDLDAATAEVLEDWSRRMLVESASPGAAIAFMRMGFEIDVRDVLSVISVPTLVVHATGDRVIDVEQARYTAQHIDGARYVELEGSNHIPWADGGDQVLPEIQEFLTGVREAVEPDRVLATVLFTDLVGSTSKLATIGDRSWRDVLEAHHVTVRRQLERFRGREIDNTGDGFLATFDGPARAIRCAEAIRAALRELGLDVRAGVHTGECEVIGEKLGGIAVHIGARVAAQAGPGEILTSSTVRDLVAGSGIAFDDRGVAELKGVPGDWQLYAVLS